MGETDRKVVDPQKREGSLNRRVAVAGIVATLAVGVLSAVVTAHNVPVIKFLGGRPVSTAARGSSGSHSTTASPGPPQPPLPGGRAFTEGSFAISGSGIDLDRNPPEAGNISDGESEIIMYSPATLYFYGAQEVAQWQQPGLPTQAECHKAEISDGVTYLHFDLTSVQQAGQQARFCILTNEGRDGYMVISGRKVVANSPIPAKVIVWATEIPVH